MVIIYNLIIIYEYRLVDMRNDREGFSDEEFLFGKTCVFCGMNM